MSSALRSIPSHDCVEAKASAPSDFQEEHLVTVIQKIGFIAACIDLHSWRCIIDEVLCEVEAANAKAHSLQTTLEALLLVPAHRDQCPSNPTSTNNASRRDAITTTAQHSPASPASLKFTPSPRAPIGPKNARQTEPNLAAQ